MATTDWTRAPRRDTIGPRITGNPPGGLDCHLFVCLDGIKKSKHV